LTVVRSLKVPELSPSERRHLSNRLYDYGKYLLDAADFAQASQALQMAASAWSSDLISKRLRLLHQATKDRANVVLWRASLIEMQRALAIVCHKGTCICKSHYAIASCMGLVEGLFDVVSGVEIHSLAGYHPYNAGHPWTRVLRRIKSAHRVELLNPVADILADFVLEHTGILRSADMVVPVPPSAEKYTERGFAPNDIVAKRLEKRRRGRRSSRCLPSNEIFPAFVKTREERL